MGLVIAFALLFSGAFLVIALGAAILGLIELHRNSTPPDGESQL